MLTLIGELKRRMVFRVASVYVAASLGVIYAADVILPRLPAPDWTVTAVIVLAGLGLFVAIVLAWAAFDVTPASIIKTPDAFRRASAALSPDLIKSVTRRSM